MKSFALRRSSRRDEFQRLYRSIAQAGTGDAAATPSLLKLYEVGEAPILSELVPVLQNFGISVISEDAHELSPMIDGKPRAALFSGVSRAQPDRRGASRRCPVSP